MKTAKKETVIPCGVAIIRHGERFLISQRRADDTLGSFWEFPGGKKAETESFEDCAVRETMEEIGVSIRVERLFMDVKKRYKGKTIWLHFFLCDYISGEPRAIDCQDTAWTDLAGLKKFKFPPTNQPVIERLFELAG